MLRLQNKFLLLANLCTVSAALQNFTALIGSRPELSNLTAYFDLHPDLVQSVLEWPNRTFLAPSNEAIAKTAHTNSPFHMGLSLNVIDANEPGIAALFSYHTLPHIYKSVGFLAGPHIIATTLDDAAYTALPGGQVVVGNGMSGQQPTLVSGLQSVSTIVVPVSWVGITLVEHVTDTWSGSGI